MRRKAGTDKPTADRVVKNIRRKTRKHRSAEEKIRIVLEGLRGEESIAALCRREGIATSLYYSWSKEFLEAGKKRLAGDKPRSERSAGRGVGPERGRCRPHSGKPLAQKKHARDWGRRHMRYPASEKLEIIRLVEQSHLPVKRTLGKLGVLKTTFYRWYARYEAIGEAGLEDRCPHPGRVWNRIPTVPVELERPGRNGAGGQ